MIEYDVALADWRELLSLLFEALVIASGSDTKGKARGGSRRKLYTEHTAAFDAKNRHGLPAEIDGGHGAAEPWANLASALHAARSTTTTVSETSASGSPVIAEVPQAEGRLQR
jgi:hypothetical protein